MISAIIIEDNIESQEYLIDIIQTNFPNIKLLGYASSITASIQLINQSNPELVFMDIELTDGLSFEIFDTIKNPSFEVIFITAFQNFLQKALEHFALSYITKPIDSSKLIATINHYLQLKQRLFSIEKINLVKELTQSRDGHILVQTTNEHILLKIATIIKCEAEGNYTYISLENGEKLLASKSLKYYNDILPASSFFRAHRSILINICFIQSIYKKETIILSNKDKVHVSTRNKSKLLELIQLLS